MFLCGWIIEFQSPETGASHEQERDVLDILDILLIGVLHTSQREQDHEYICFVMIDNENYVEDFQNVWVPNH